MAVTAQTVRSSGVNNSGNQTTVAGTTAFTPALWKTFALVWFRTDAAFTAPGTIAGNDGVWRPLWWFGHSSTLYIGLYQLVGGTPSSGVQTYTAAGADTFDAAWIRIFDVTADMAKTFATNFVFTTWASGAAQEQSVSISPVLGTAKCLFGAGIRAVIGSATPRTDWTEHADDQGDGSPAATIHMQGRVGTDSAVSATWSSTTGIGIQLGWEVVEEGDMDIEPVGWVEAAIDSGTGTQNVTLPSGMQEGDAVFVQLAADAAISNAGGDGGITTGGYANIHAGDAGADPGHLLAYKFMGSTPDTTVTIDQINGTKIAVAVLVLRGVDPTVPLDGVTPVTAPGSSGLPDPGALTPATNGATFLAAGALDDDDAGINNPPQGFGDFIRANTGQASTTVGATAFLATRHVASAAEVNPGAFGGLGTDAWVSTSAALRPAPAAPTGPSPGALYYYLHQRRVA